MLWKRSSLLGLALVMVLTLCLTENDVRLSSRVSAQSKEVTITIAYNRFLTQSFTPGQPAPFEIMKATVAQKYPNIKLQMNLVPDSVDIYHDALAVWLSAKDPTIDIYGMDMPWVAEFGKAGWTVPLNDRIPDLSQSFIKDGLDTFSYAGKLLGVPFWSSINGLFYRKDLLQQYGIQPPASFDDLVAAAGKIMAAQPDLTGFAWPGAKDEALIMVWAAIFNGFGGQYYDASGKCAFNSPKGIEALQFMVDLLKKGISPQETIAWNAEEAHNRFAQGKAIFLLHNADLVSWLDNPEKSQVAGKWGFIQNPAQPGGRHAGLTGGFAFALNPYTDNMDEALQVLQLIAGREIQKGFAMAWGPVQYYKGLYDDPEVLKANANANLITAVLPSAVSRPPSTQYAQLSTILQEEIHSALAGIKPVKEAMDDACSRLESTK